MAINSIDFIGHECSLLVTTMIRRVKDIEVTMQKNRPYQNLGIEALERMAEASYGDIEQLTAILHELKNRSTSRAKALDKRLDEHIKKMMTNTQSQTDDLPMNKPSSIAKKDVSKKVAQYPEGFLVDNFEALRSRLLDTVGSRSRLLNLDQNRKGFVRVVDALPDTLASSLLSEKPMRIVPVDEPTLDELIEHGYLERDEENEEYTELKPHPTAKEWAAIKGINNEYELPNQDPQIASDSSVNSDIQTLLYPPVLDNNLRSLSRDAKTSIEETGNNILFLSLGFLEYSEQAEKDGTARKRLAPLFMIPVEIDKKAIKNVNSYRIKYTGEDIINNLTLKEKLSHDFGIHLPDVYGEDEMLLKPEVYFEEVEKLLALKQGDNNIRHWRVRRFATLATLSLGKLLMYRDLDPELWASNGVSLLDHGLISNFFGTAKKEDISGVGLRSDIYEIDKMPKLHDDFPVVEDADSSQMSALIDALNGENLVIEGPPGTGKSQTITNLIAGALAQKKTVLFVAEKQAALDVVKRRLDKVGLGDFCLDLHSDKAQKKRVLETFEQRIAKQSLYKFSNADYLSQVRQYDKAKEELQTYVDTVNQQWKETGLTIHEILSAATRYAKEADIAEYSEVMPEGLTGENFSRFFLDDQLLELERFYDYLERVASQLEDAGNWPSHPWYGVNNKNLSAQPDSLIKSVLSKWIESYEAIFHHLAEIVASFGGALDESSTLFIVQQWLNEWSNLPALKGKEEFSSFKAIQETDLSELKQVCYILQNISELYRQLGQTFNRPFLESLHQASSISASLETLKKVGVPEHITLYELVASVAEFEKLSSLLAELNENRLALKQSFSTNATDLFTPDRAGLNELATFTGLLGELPAEYIRYRCVEYDDITIDQAILNYREDIAEVEHLREKIEQTLKLDELPKPEQLENYAQLASETKMFSFLNKDWRIAKKHIHQFVTVEKFSFKGSAKILFTAANWLRKVDQINNSDIYKTAFGPEFKGVETDLERITSIREWYKKIREHYGVGFGRKVPLASAAFDCSIEHFRGIQTLAANGLVDKTETLNKGFIKLAELFPKEICLSDEHFELTQDTSLLESIKLKVKLCLEDVQQHLCNPNLAQSELLEAVKDVEKLKALIIKLESANVSQRFFSGKLDLNSPINGHLPTDYDALADTVDFIGAMYEKIQLPVLREQIIACKTDVDYEELRDTRNGLNDIEAEEHQYEMEFFKLIEADIESWLYGRKLTVASLLAKNTKALDSFSWLDGWLKYLHARERLDSTGFSNLKDYLIKNTSGIEHAKKVLKFSCYRTIADEIYAAVPLLSKKSGHEQSATRKKFSEIDEKLKVLQQKRIAALAAKVSVPEGQRGAKVSSYTGKALLTHEIGKKTRHIAIRRLVERAGTAMLAYKPCFMMSPMAVAKYIPPGAVEFDLVVMDEASQVKQEYALSCFARGKSVVVVGDPKQLPPTNFFEKVTTDEDTEDTSVIQDSESILEAISGFTPKRMLQWHYRSQHESLIAFSNHNFYDSRLVVFPSPYDQSDEFGIKHHPVEDGRFLQGVNQVESREVAKAIQEHLLRYNSESLGVVAMNAKQRDLIEADLESLAAKDKKLADALAVNRDKVEPLFIKNLENVQGDERDVIFISFTYGPTEKGVASIPQRFGPINSENGWRRLNVLFTRAKKRKHIFTSMRSGQILVSETSSRGVEALRDYLNFVETGRLSGASRVTGREPDSDFEIAVIDALEKQGYQCEPQLGVEGYFIDIAVRDPGMRGRYLMGIECDGASYHSAKSTRDRDKVRQMVLEGLGWNIKRIWSTDWFKNPDGELKPILDELAKLSTPVTEKKDDVSESTLSIDEPNLSTDAETSIAYNASEDTLEARLLSFQAKVVGKTFPNTDPEERLLRPEILKRLLIYKPVDHDDFMEFIPQYLRLSTSKEEAAEFLDAVLEMIAEYEEEQR